MRLSIFSRLTAIFWIAWAVYWLVSARGAKRSIRGWSWRLQIGFRVAAVAIVYVLIRLRVIHIGAAGHAFSSFVRLSTATPSGVLLGVAGSALCAAGLAFAIWARTVLGRNWGMPMTLRVEHELVISGPYKWVRHPIYTGLILAMIGSVFADGPGWLVILLFAAVYFVYSAKTEEKLMLEQFPNAYPEYMRRTKALIPFVR